MLRLPSIASSGPAVFHPSLRRPAGSVNVPFDEFERRAPAVRQLCGGAVVADGMPAAPLVVVCRRGNDSQVGLGARFWGYLAVKPRK